jgi:predicted pyridoxine 5'-phosphate oxidase superfamily flavin-nucleotide-binding protein
VLDPEIVTLLESDAVLVVGTVDADGVPDATYAWYLRVVDDVTPEIRLLYPVGASRTAANLATTGRIAATVTDVATLASAQVKGRVTGTTPVTAADERAADRRFDALARRIHEVDGTALDVIERSRPGPLRAVTFRVEEVYDQTPGPDAGRRVGPDPPDPEGV